MSGNATVKNRILKTELVKWSELKDLQPEDSKVVTNFADIKQSIEKHGFAQPFFVWQDKDGSIFTIDGHTRRNVLCEIENVPDKLPATFIDAEDRKEAIEILIEVYNQKHNPFDITVLEEFIEIEGVDVDINTVHVNFDNQEEAEELEAKEDDYEIPDEIKTDIVLGDLFEIGEHRLLCGDSTDSDQVAKLMNGQKADLGVTDPPYNLGYKYATYDDNLTSKEYNDFIIGYVNNLILFSDKQIITSGKQNVGYYYKNFDITEFAVWYAKNKMSGSKISYLGLCEPILFIGKFERNARPTDMFEYNVKQQQDVGGHTCPKVLELFADLIKSYCKTLTLDLFLGSGTTMVAAHQLKRKCYGMELDPKYCQVIIDRMLKLDPDIKITRNGQQYKPFNK